MKMLQLHRRWVMLLLVLTVNLLAAGAFAQVRISGKVTGKNDTGVEAASVTVKGTTSGAATDNNGIYGFTAALKPGDYTLVFSSGGYKSQELTLKITAGTNSYTVNATLTEDFSKLDEVIVTGTSAGTTRRQLGSYIASVKADDLTQGATGNVLAALQGKTAGAQISQNSGDPAGGLSVRLRGISSISSSSEPLYIIDGVIVNNATNRVTNTSGNYDGNNFIGNIGQSRMVDINPNDIDRIEVLNGAAAAAIYGSRANAGVVQIFTKKGKSGVPVISFSSSYTNSSLRKKLDVNQSPTKFGGPTDGPGAQTQDILTPTLTNTTNVTRYDYQDYIFRNASGTDNNISISGGTEKTKYYVSGSYFFNQGIIRNTDFQRFSFRSNIDQVLNKWASFNIGLNYVNSSANEKPDGNSFFSPMNSVTIIGNFHNIWQRDALGNLLAVGERGRVNPVSVIEDIKQKQTTNRVIANMGLKLKPWRKLSIDYTMGIDNYAQNGTTYIPPFTYNVNTAFYGGGSTLDPTQNGYASTASNNFFAINHDLNATFNTDITSDINSVTQVGFSQQYEKNNYALLQGRGLAPFVHTVNGASTILGGVDERSEISVSGAYVQQNFKFRNQFFLTGAVRVDGSSVFGKDQRNQTYYKASGSYVLSGTDFWAKSGVSKWWDLFKIRLAYGESGNLTGIGAYSRFNTYSSSSYVGRTALNSSSTLANENVKPERQQETELGFDMSFLNNRLGLTVNIYNKKVKDLLINRFIAPSTGFSSLLDNFGSLENKGYEVVLTGSPVASKDLKWEITGIFNHNRNKAVSIGQALTLLSTNAGAPVAIIEGQPIGIFYGTPFARDASGNLLVNPAGFLMPEKGTQNNVLSYTPGRDGTGMPTGGTVRKVIGNPNPDYTASLVNELSYKKLSLRVQIDAVRGVNVFNADFRTRQGVGNGKVAEMEQRGQLPRGYINNIYATVEEWRVSDGSYTKLRELALTYHFGKMKWMNDLSVSFSARNLISWDNYNGYDPEVNAGGQSTILRGIDFGAVPIPKTFSFGIQAKF
ncbi:SusC/RagA family TonB-linked outer membrane protein [Sediminibacterium ginsengisoli]|uniref:TonB-linked outer membrane protein, SusC/RagA family n=1 Tax=Sediminibacterium ginsengisoli TaxID=413434 RepID=A0A1T4JZE5_9BACT|nr:SusC/RagA family TonB-linked outer membrane protein [Sediminibacterium ginsengisoli]SJZ35531.1 TonB-linked outer membrane protein, SusC/RagA family [Sediminibacterium ginsengisoli]